MTVTVRAQTRSHIGNPPYLSRSRTLRGRVATPWIRVLAL
jgi:hypothetical protein